MAIEQRGRNAYWVDLDFACGLVVTNEKGIIIHTMPVLKRFRGQHISKLESWKRYKGRKQLDESK